MADDENYKLKREKNNQSVKKCRENEKKKVEMATEKLEEYKKENKSLEDKYESLKKELGVLKSLFMQSSEKDPSAMFEASKASKNPIDTNDEAHCSKKIKANDEVQLNENRSAEVLSDAQETQLELPILDDPFELDILPNNFKFNSSLDNPFLNDK